MKNTLTLALSLCALSLVGACNSGSPPATGNDDLAMSLDMSGPSPDLFMPFDFAFTPPDLTMACGHGQTMSGAMCVCDAAHAISCGGAKHCCAASPVNQSCLGVGAFGETRCSGPALGRGQTLFVYNPARAESILRTGICETGAADVLCTDQWRFGAVTWDPMGTVAGPTNRYNSAMIYDGRSKGLMLFGGLTVLLNENSANGEMWTYDGAAWKQVTIAGSPPARANHAMAFDSTRAVVVLFGGLANATTSLNDTWEYDGTRWQQRSTVNTPMPREGHRMVYDTKRQRVVMFGGIVSGLASRETWTYDGSDWTRLSDNAAMAVRSEAAMAYDEDRGVVVMFGGRDMLGATALNDLWEFDGTSWARKTVAGAPSVRLGAAMTYDSARKEILMYGGDPINMAQLKDLWAWNGTRWAQMY